MTGRELKLAGKTENLKVYLSENLGKKLEESLEKKKGSWRVKKKENLLDTT